MILPFTHDVGARYDQCRHVRLLGNCRGWDLELRTVKGKLPKYTAKDLQQQSKGADIGRSHVVAVGRKDGAGPDVGQQRT